MYVCMYFCVIYILINGNKSSQALHNRSTGLTISVLVFVVLKSLSHVRLFFYPMNCSLPGSSVYGISQARILEWYPFPSPGNLPNFPVFSGMKMVSLALAGWFFTTEPPGHKESEFRYYNVLFKIVDKFLNKICFLTKQLIDPLPSLDLFQAKD